MVTSPQTMKLEVLGRYLDGTASTVEGAAVEAWIGRRPERRAALEQLRAAWIADASKLQASYDADPAWRRLAARVGLKRGAAPRSAFAARWWPVAAAAVSLAVVGGGAWWLGRSRAPRPPAVPTVREYATRRGQRAVFRLLDGTEVMLNADTRLRVPLTYVARRSVDLVGEAYFSVVHDSTHPFTVHTQRTDTRDVGTRFAVRSYVDSPDDRVAVAEGAVVVRARQSSAGAEAELHRGQVGSASGAGAPRVIAGANAGAELAWTKGRLVFTNTPLAEVAERLGRWFDIDVQVADSALARRAVTGSYGAEPVADVLTLISSAVGARYTWRDGVVWIGLASGAR